MLLAAFTDADFKRKRNQLFITNQLHLAPATLTRVSWSSYHSIFLFSDMYELSS